MPAHRLQDLRQTMRVDVPCHTHHDVADDEPMLGAVASRKTGKDQALLRAIAGVLAPGKSVSKTSRACHHPTSLSVHVAAAAASLLPPRGLEPDLHDGIGSFCRIASSAVTTLLADAAKN